MPYLSQIRHLSLHAAGGETGDHVFLYLKEHRQNGQRHKDRCCREERPATAVVVGLQLIQPARQGVAGAVQQKGGGKKILIPNGDEHHHTGDHNGRFGQRKHDAQDHLPVAGTVDAGGLLDVYKRQKTDSDKMPP